MGRLALHSKLEDFAENVYFQPPSNIRLTYPCIIYHKNGKSRSYSNDNIYLGTQKYGLTVIDKDPDSIIADLLEEHLQYCTIVDNFTMDNLNHTSLTLYHDVNTINLGGSDL